MSNSNIGTEIAADLPQTTLLVQVDENAVKASALAEAKAIETQAVGYLESALQSASGQVNVAVSDITTDAENLAFKTADAHGFSAFLALFKGTIEGGVAKLSASAATEVQSAIAAGIAHLKTVKI